MRIYKWLERMSGVPAYRQDTVVKENGKSVIAGCGPTAALMRLAWHDCRHGKVGQQCQEGFVSGAELRRACRGGRLFTGLLVGWGIARRFERYD